MRPYDKIFFVCTSNTLLSPIAEGIYRSEAAVYMPEPYSRGLVVLFEEPISPKVNLLLSKHEMTPGNHSQSMQLQKEELTDKTLILTMTFPEKVQFLENVWRWLCGLYFGGICRSRDGCVRSVRSGRGSI